MVDPAVRALARAVADRSGCRPCDVREHVETWLTEETSTWTTPPSWLGEYLTTRIPGRDSSMHR